MNKRIISSIVSTVKDAPEYSQQSILGGYCFNATQQLKFTNKKISNVISELKDLLEEFNGSETQDVMMQRKHDFIETLEKQVSFYEKHKENTYAAYREVVGSDYIMPAPKGTFDRTKTQSAEDARELLAKYASKQQSRINSAKAAMQAFKPLGV